MGIEALVQHVCKNEPELTDAERTWVQDLLQSISFRGREESFGPTGSSVRQQRLRVTRDLEDLLGGG